MNRIARLQCIITGPSHAHQAALALDGGAQWIQLRDKNMPQNELVFVARELSEICKAQGAVLIINDHVEVAREIDADGVHLGTEDMSIKNARELLGSEAIIGGSAHNLREYQQLQESELDYIGLGPIRFTDTKQDLAKLMGLDGAREIINASPGTIPVVLIGGIQVSDVRSAIELGAHGLAVASAVNKESDPSGAVVQFLDHIKTSLLSHA